MRRAIALLLVLAMVLLPGCRKEDKWQKQFDLGCKYLSDGDYKEAILAFDLAVEIDPKKPETYLYRGDAYKMLALEYAEDGDYDKAEKYLDKAYDDYDRAEDWGYDDEDELEDRWEELEILIEEILIQDVGPDGKPPKAEPPVAENTSEKTMELYRTFFYTKFDDNDLVVLKDVTGDGRDEMLVVDLVDAQGFEINGYVFTLDGNAVKQIYTNSGSSVHAGGFYGWYLVERDGRYCLAEEGFGMWQGVGILSFTQYKLNENGKKTVVEELVLDSEDEGKHDAYGMVTEEAYYDYVNALNRVMEKCYCLYATACEGSGGMWIETFPPVVFGTMEDAGPVTSMEQVGVEDAFLEIYQNPYGDYTYCCHIPRYVLADNRCAVMNEQIYQDLSRIMSSHQWDFGYEEGQCGVSICYEKGQNNGIASLVAQVTVQNSDYWYFRTYNMNVESGWEATDQEVIAAFGMTENEFRQKLGEVLMPWFENTFKDGYSEMITDDEYIELYVMTTCEENLRQARPCIDEMGRLCAIVDVYGFAGAGCYPYRICLEGNPQGSGHWISCEVHR